MKNAPPALYALALLGFFLPWSSLTCSVPDFESGDSKTIKISQSGLQMVTGNTSVTMNGKTPTDEEQAEMEEDGTDGPNQALLLILFPIALVVGIAMSFSNLQAAGIAGIVAFAVAMLQMAIGFPLFDIGPPGMASNTIHSQPDVLVKPVVFQPDLDSEDFQKSMEELGQQMEGLEGMGGMEGIEGLDSGMDALMGEAFKKTTEPFFWLSSLLALIGGILCFVAANQATVVAAGTAPAQIFGDGEG
jgi:hypothetical protein|uniref:Uncharacterized protein n=1 Tax=uncultured marine group II/III euryarchaeote KM3_170_G02 TaxID=1457927 RepID=A0A075GLY0_9EURY|nr:hypothetical protein [uncultured marine group II/III euryarchaeote KM3_170_G02]